MKAIFKILLIFVLFLSAVSCGSASPQPLPTVGFTTRVQTEIRGCGIYDYVYFSNSEPFCSELTCRIIGPVVVAHYTYRDPIPEYVSEEVEWINSGNKSCSFNSMNIWHEWATLDNARLDYGTNKLVNPIVIEQKLIDEFNSLK